MNRTSRDILRSKAVAIAQIVGQRAAARQLGLNEDTLGLWIHRLRKANPDIVIDTNQGLAKHVQLEGDVDSTKALEKALNMRGNATKLQLAIAADNASSKMAEMQPHELIQRDTAQAADSWSRAADRTHGWSAERSKAPVVQIANITIPTPEQMQADKETDAKLDRITALLATKSE